MELDVTIVLPGSPEEIMWAALLQLKEPAWPVSAAAIAAGCPGADMARYLRKLERAGFAVSKRVTRSKVRHYRLQRRPKLAPRLRLDGKPTMQQPTEQLWRAMRMAKTFAAEELAAACVKVSRHAARRYCTELVRAGVLVGGTEGYRLVRDLGPRPPKLISVAIVLDGNSETLLGWPEAREVQP